MFFDFGRHPVPYPERPEWRGYLHRWRDGDSCEFFPDQGFTSTHRVPVRVDGFDAPEVVGADKARGLAAKARAEALIPPGSPIRVWTQYNRNGNLRKSLDRYIGTLHYWDADGIERDFTETMIREGHTK